MTIKELREQYDVETKTLEELRAMSENSTDIDLLTDIYKEIEDRNFIEQANGSLSALANLRDGNGEGTLFDDCFFNCEDIAKKYDDWDEDFNCRAYDLANCEILEKLDDEDKKAYADFLKASIEDFKIQEEYKSSKDNYKIKIERRDINELE